ncbi:MAG: hypothetical protein VCA36_11290 [Opitutales bacterium]
MKRFILLFSSAFAWFALAGCGDDPTIKEPEPSQKTEVGIHGNQIVIDKPEDPPPKEPPPLPAFVLEEPYATYLKQAADSKQIHFGIWEEGVADDPIRRVFTAGEGADKYYRGIAKKPFTGWLKEWHDNGGLSELTYFKDGHESGVCVFWYDNGVMESKGYFEGGLEQGEWISWNKEGNETKRETYEQGARVEN